MRRAQRYAADILGGVDLRPPPAQDVSKWPIVVRVVQPMGTTPAAEQKQHNIALAAGAFSGRPVRPGAMFSFWAWLGAPTLARGFQEGRALRNGALIKEAGGGLCQLSGALYFAGLQAGLIMVERHAHSIDLYSDETRFAPLGSDATVSFGFKDLRLRNPHDCAVAFSVQAVGATLDVAVHAERALPALAVNFAAARQLDGSVIVETRVGGAMTARTRYETLANSASAASRV